MSAETKISPLAPKSGFPSLPSVKGVTFSAHASGIKNKNRVDTMLALISPLSSIAGVFTKSSTRSRAVLDCQEKLQKQCQSNSGFAFLVNSGNANAFTGKVGDLSVRKLVTALSDSLGLPESNILTSSTGVIGEPLPVDKLINAIPVLKNSLREDNFSAAASAIMTTDTFSKGAGETISVEGKSVNISGIAKGSGMIAPDMATMLVYIFTDASISKKLLQKVVSELVEKTFNCITVDSDTSTSDTLLVAATGKSGISCINSINSDSYKTFKAGLEKVMLNLCHQVVKDGEGATKFIEVLVEEAKLQKDSHNVAMSVANSPLVKTAIAGEDPNWGRIIMAIGKSGAQVERDKISIYFGDLLVAKNGWLSPNYQESKAAQYMKNQELLIRIKLGVGVFKSTVWTCDLTHSYISINADYRS
ncbi:MAG: bifunctional ornithine acetyltransferase/N-acetylglutamate synthase [Rhodobacteraceae bacterium]|nr:bifunctional ornithine acetyltransferase/N-acetylglutamate synthase [Paracoccaceae bacterium]